MILTSKGQRIPPTAVGELLAKKAWDTIRDILAQLNAHYPELARIAAQTIRDNLDLIPARIRVEIAEDARQTLNRKLGPEILIRSIHDARRILRELSPKTSWLYLTLDGTESSEDIQEINKVLRFVNMHWHHVFLREFWRRTEKPGESQTSDASFLKCAYIVQYCGGDDAEMEACAWLLSRCAISMHKITFLTCSDQMLVDQFIKEHFGLEFNKVSFIQACQGCSIDTEMRDAFSKIIAIPEHSSLSAAVGILPLESRLPVIIRYEELVRLSVAAPQT